MKKETPMTAYAYYRVELDRADGTTAVEFRKRRKATTAKGMDRQHNNVVNDVIEELRYYRVEGWKRLTVTRVPESEVTSSHAR
jgi:hypothetical protein